MFKLTGGTCSGGGIHTKNTRAEVVVTKSNCNKAFVLGTDKTTSCPTGYQQVPKDLCLKAYQYLMETDKNKNWQHDTTLRSWGSSWDPSGCIVYLHDGKWQHFFNTSGGVTGLQRNRFPVCKFVPSMMEK